MRLARDVELEQDLVEADKNAPRRDSDSVGAARHPGINEDRVLCDPANGVAAIFDGIGGEAGGELAARAACGAMAVTLGVLPSRTDLEGRRRWLATAVQSAQQAISLSRRVHGDCARQGTTAIAAVMGTDRVLTTCVGDSRAYRVRQGDLVPIADEYEDTVPRPAIAGELDRVSCVADFEGRSKDLPWAFNYRNLISAELGSATVKPTIHEHHVARGDLIVLLSDGVHDNLSHQEMESVVAACAGQGPLVLSTALVAAAQRRSQDSQHLRAKDDDVSCAVLRAS